MKQKLLSAAANNKDMQLITEQGVKNCAKEHKWQLRINGKRNCSFNTEWQASKLIVNVFSYTASDDHTAKLINNEYIDGGRRCTESLLKNLQNRFNSSRSVFQADRHVTKHQDSIVQDHGWLTAANKKNKIKPLVISNA
jgi:hypothetical protein